MYANTSIVLSANGSELSFSMNLSDNPLVCACSTREFLEWVQQTDEHMYRSENYTCTFLDEEELLTSVSLGDECASFQTWIPVLTVAVLLVLLGQSVWTAIYVRRKYRKWKWKRRIQLAIGRYRDDEHARQKFLVLLAYSSDDSWLWRRFIRGLNKNSEKERTSSEILFLLMANILWREH
jgi:hypothetical protein